jgi:hypothetical protein
VCKFTAFVGFLLRAGLVGFGVKVKTDDFSNELTLLLQDLFHLIIFVPLPVSLPAYKIE